jgi:DNA-binding transcriptional ArsR family regulator
VTNPYGDVELDALGMRALAHPVRLAILSRLQRHGPATATRLAPHVGASPSVTSWHLRHLAAHGLVRDADTQGSGRERWWEAVSHGFRVGPDDGSDPEAFDAARRALWKVLGDVTGDPREEWTRSIEPHLSREWLHVAHDANTRILATPAEVAAIVAAFEEILAPYVLRKTSDADVPADARGVRLLTYVLPEGDVALA